MSNLLPTCRTYVLRYQSIQAERSDELSKEQFDETDYATRVLQSALQSEQRLELLIENYLAVERMFLDLALRETVYPFGERKFERGRNEANRHLINFLASSRAYADHTKTDLSETFGRYSHHLQNFASAAERAEKTSFEFACIKLLRDCSQHRDFPAHAITFAFRRLNAEADHVLEHRVFVSLNVKELLLDRKADKSTLSKMQSKADRNGYLPILPLVRGYMSELGRIHEVVRHAMSEACVPTLETVRDVLRGSPIQSCHVFIERWASDELEFKKFVSTRDAELRDEYLAKNAKLERLQDQIVTSNYL